MVCNKHVKAEKEYRTLCRIPGKAAHKYPELPTFLYLSVLFTKQFYYFLDYRLSLVLPVKQQRIISTALYRKIIKPRTFIGNSPKGNT